MLNHEAATNMDLPSSKIVNKHIDKLPAYLKGRMPKVASVKRTAYRKQTAVAEKVPENPTNLDTIVLPDKYKILTTGDGDIQWYYPLVGENDSHIFMFTTKKQLDILNNAKNIYTDGTFKVR